MTDEKAKRKDAWCAGWAGDSCDVKELIMNDDKSRSYCRCVLNMSGAVERSTLLF